MDILDELKMLADHIDDENNGKPDALSLLLIRTIGEIRKLRADLAKVTWQRNEAQAGLAAMTKSRDAAMRIVTAKDQQMSVLRTQQDQWSEARNTLESERAANARITADLAASQAECERLLLEGWKHEQKPSAAGVAMPEHVEQLAITRYRPVPNGMFGYKVVAGDGARSVFEGTKSECTLIARKLTEAFLDGAHAAIDAALVGEVKP